MGVDDAHAQPAPESAPTRSGAQDSGYGSLQSTAAQQPAHIQSKSLVAAYMLVQSPSLLTLDPRFQNMIRAELAMAESRIGLCHSFGSNLCAVYTLGTSPRGQPQCHQVVCSGAIRRALFVCSSRSSLVSWVPRD